MKPPNQHIRSVIWTPDMHSLEEVAAAALAILEQPGAASEDIHQASHLLTTIRVPQVSEEYVTMKE